MVFWDSEVPGHKEVRRVRVPSVKNRRDSEPDDNPSHNLKGGFKKEFDQHSYAIPLIIVAGLTFMAGCGGALATLVVMAESQEQICLLKVWCRQWAYQGGR